MTESVVGFIGAALLFSGLTLASIGLYGMLRKPIIFEQLHAAGLISGPGIILVLLAALASGSAEAATSAFLMIAFVLVTSSLSTHAIALAAWRLGSASPEDGEWVRDTQRAVVAGSGAPATGAMRVIVAHDGSPGADMATALVGSLSWPDASEIRLVGVMEGDIQPVPLADAAPAAPAGNTPASADLKAVLVAAARTLRRPGLTVDAVVRPGEPAAAISGEADAFGAHLVVTGSRGLGRMEALFAGSVAAAVIDGAPCPVLVARGPIATSVLLATDGSEASTAATETLARWPVFAGVPIEVLTIATAVPQYGDPPAGAGMREAVEKARQQKVADAAAMTLRDAGRQALPHVRTGAAAAQIAGFATARSIDLIVLGSRGRTGLTRALLGSVAREVLSSSRASVLIVRAAPDPTSGAEGE